MNIEISHDKLMKAIKQYDEMCGREQMLRKRGKDDEADRVDRTIEGMEMAFNLLGIEWADL